MTKEDVKNRSIENFKSGYNCAQSVLLAFSDFLGVDSDVLARISQPFGGGVCRTRETCGAVNGMLMVAGLQYGKDDASDKKSKDDVYGIGQHLMAEFEKANGSCICRKLLGLEKSENTSVSEPRSSEYYKKRPCAELCGIASEIVWEYMMNKKS